MVKSLMNKELLTIMQEGAENSEESRRIATEVRNRFAEILKDLRKTTKHTARLTGTALKQEKPYKWAKDVHRKAQQEISWKTIIQETSLWDTDKNSAIQGKEVERDPTEFTIASLMWGTGATLRVLTSCQIEEKMTGAGINCYEYTQDTNGNKKSVSWSLVSKRDIDPRSAARNVNLHSSSNWRLRYTERDWWESHIYEFSFEDPRWGRPGEASSIILELPKSSIAFQKFGSMMNYVVLVKIAKYMVPDFLNITGDGYDRSAKEFISNISNGHVTIDN